MTSPSAPYLQAERANREMTLRWLIWSVLALAYLIVLFHRMAPGVVADRLMAQFEAGGAAVGILTSIYFWVYGVMQVPSGLLADSLGTRKTVSIGAALAGLGSLVFGLAPALEMAYLGRFLVGLGVSVIFVATLKFQASWFRPEQFGTLSGLLILVGNLGSVIATTPVALMAQSLGWRAPFLAIGAASCGVALAAWCGVRDYPSWKSVAMAEAPRKHLSLRAGARIIWRDRQTRAGFLAHFGLLGSYLTFSALWAVPYLMHVYGMDRAEAANYLLVTSLGMIVSAPLAGHLSDRVLRQRKLPIVALGMLGSAVWLALTLWNAGQPAAWALYPLFAALGVSAGNVTLVLTSVKEANPPELSGLAMGAANAGFLCAALLQPAMGYLLDSRWLGEMLAGARVYPVGAYHLVFAVLTGVSLLGLLGAVLMKETHGRNVPLDRASS